MRHKISQQDGIQYKKVASIDEIKNEHTLDYHDLSVLDLREHKDLFMYAPTESMPRSGIRGWMILAGAILLSLFYHLLRHHL